MSLAIEQPDIALRQRLRLRVWGRVQGVGFRPWVFRLAGQWQLTGWVQNHPWGVILEVEGPPVALKEFSVALEASCPPPACIEAIESLWLDAAGYDSFHIKESETRGHPAAVVLPDLAPCADCQRELLDPADRRFRYPFINCTQCGPRYSIIRSLPYDRFNTSMHGFLMCAPCRAEYEQVENRRFHAQPNACPQCGPHLEWWDAEGRAQATHEDALLQAVATIRKGGVVALKGLGGFQLVCDATQPQAVAELRRRKQRPTKPFALLFPSLDAVQEVCAVSDTERRLLLSPEAPIVLLRLRDPFAAGKSAEWVAPGHPHWGVMLPATPLHHLLAKELARPLVATSGNLSDETLCFDERDALRRLTGLADGFLVHNRPIVRHVDDSIVRVVAGSAQVLRRARGYAPLPVVTKHTRAGLLAVGGHLKNTVALSLDNETILSQHVGDLDTAQSRDAQEKTARDLSTLFACPPQRVVADLHPDYASTHFAETFSLPLKRVQHHVAHVMACLAENEIVGPALGVAWDGAGWGPDGTLWGGEFLRVTDTGIERLAHVRTFPLPGGEAALREPRRAALGLLYAHWGEAVFDPAIQMGLNAFLPQERAVLQQALARNLNCPQTSSMGRLFDAVASLLNLKQIASYEGEAAALLEFAAEEGRATGYPFHLETSARPWVLDWAPMLAALLLDLKSNRPVAACAAAFHQGLIEALVQVARQTGEHTVALSGGCFQNRILAEQAVRHLRHAGLNVVWHRQVPPNDGGLALGQIAAVDLPLKV